MKKITEYDVHMSVICGIVFPGDKMQMNRLFEIIYILMNKSTVTAKELAERFEVSQRTIYRDIDNLSLAGIPVYTSKGKGGGIHLMEDFVLNKSLLSEKEQREILSALHGLSAVKAVDTGDILGKLSSLFQQDATPWLEVDFSDWSYQNGNLFEILKTGILEKRVVEFYYYSGGGDKTYRRFEPIQLWFKHRAWYVKGYCLIRNSMRVFKLSRMVDPVLTDEIFQKRDLLAVIAGNETGEAPPKKDIRLKLKISPEMTFRVYDEFGEEYIEKLPDGSFLVTVVWPEDEWVYSFILSFGEYAEIVEPPHIKKRIERKLKNALKNYL